MSIRQVCVALVATLCLASTAVQAENPAPTTNPAPATPQELSKIAGWSGKALRSEQAFNFVILSDRTGGNIKGLWPKAIEEVNLLQPDFVICVGDLIGGYIEDREELLAQWKEFETETASLDAPFFYVGGNHDLTNEVMREIYIDRHGVDGRTFYSFDYRGSHFVVLDSMALMGPPGEQLAWLEKDIAQAGEANHVFVFYHHPLWENLEIWPKLAAILPAGKTTIFNGHTHALGYSETDGIQTYVLSASAAQPGENNIHMYARVAVDGDRRHMTLLPMPSLLPMGYAEWMSKIKLLWLDHAALLDAEGDQYTYRMTNSLDKPLELTMVWDAEGWNVSPAERTVTIQPGEKISQTFQLVAGPDVKARPALKLSYDVENPYLNETISLANTIRLGMRSEMTAAAGRSITVDGKTDDWAGIKPLALQRQDLIFKSPYNWSGPKDSSCLFRVAADDEMLYAIAVVRDDDVWADPEAPAWFADAIEFLWDIRPEATRTDARTVGTGQVILTVPTDGSNKPGENWFMNGVPVPEGFRAAYAPTDGGYVIEWAVPLKELPLTKAPAPGDVIHIGLLLNDRDHGGEAGWNVSRFSASGMGNESGNTTGYIRVTFE